MLREGAEGGAVVRRPAAAPSATKVLHGRRVPVHLLVVDVGLRLILWRQSVRPNLQRARLPGEPVEAICGASEEPSPWPICQLTDSTGSVLPAAHEDVAIASAAVIGSQADIGSQNGAGLAEEVFQVLPAYSVRELRVR